MGAPVDLATYSMNPFAIPPAIAMIATCCLGVAVLIRERGSLVSLLFAAMTASVGVWLFAFTWMYCAQDPHTALWWAKAAYFGVPFIVASGYHFAVAVLQGGPATRRFVVLGWVAAAVFSAAGLLTDELVTGVRRFWWGYYPAYGWLSAPFLVFFLAWLGMALREFWQVSRLAAPGSLQQQRARALFIAFAIESIGLVDYCAKYGLPVYPFGYVAVLAFVILAARAIWRYRLADFKAPLATSSILQRMQEALAVLDLEGTVQLANRSACELLGIPSHRLQGRPLASVLSHPALMGPLAGGVQTDQPREYEVRYARRSGDLRTLSVSLYPIWDEAKRPSAVGCFLRDVTVRKQAEVELTRMQELAESWKRAQNPSEAGSRRPAELARRRPGLLAPVEQAGAEQAKAEGALRQLAAVVDACNDAIISKSLDGTILTWNKGAERIYGYTAQEAIGRSIAMLIPPEARDELPRILEGVRQGAAAERETVRVAKDGRRLQMCLTISPIRDDAGSIIGGSVVARDITERKRVDKRLQLINALLVKHQRELSRALAAAKRANDELRSTQLQLIQSAKLESVGRLAAGVAHEVKNPLATLLIGIDHLADHFGPNANGAGELLRDMAQAVKRADAVIRGLLDFSAPQELAMGVQDLSPIVEQALTFTKHLQDRQHIALVKDLAPSLPPLQLDRPKIEQVLVNLFLNAIQAMPQGGTLTVRAISRPLKPGDPQTGRRQTDAFRIGEPAVILEVLDTGSGIPDDKLSKVFDPFFTTKPTGQGTGLGLTVTKKIMELHGGFIHLTNRPEGGVATTLIFRAHARLAPGGMSDGAEADAHLARG